MLDKPRRRIASFNQGYHGWVLSNLLDFTFCRMEMPTYSIQPHAAIYIEKLNDAEDLISLLSSFPRIKVRGKDEVGLAILTSTTLVGGGVLVVYGLNIEPVDNYDFLDSLVGYRFDVFTVLLGVIQIAVTLISLYFIFELEKEPGLLKSSVNHYVRNALQTVINDLELAAEFRGNPELSAKIENAKTACMKVIEVLEDVTEGEIH